jgi:molybdate transport system regulatory protein
MNRAFQRPVITTATGGREGGGTVLTATGEEIIRRYRRIESVATAAAQKDISALGKLMRH